MYTKWPVAFIAYLDVHFFLQNLTSRIAFEKPEDPLQFMLNEIEKIQRGEKLKELCTTS